MPSFEFVVKGPPVSVNLIKKNPRSKKAREWTAAVQDAAVKQWERDKRLPAEKPWLVPLSVVITVYFTATRLDVDNAIKPILDAMEKVLYDDDSSVFRIAAERVDLRRAVRTEIPSALVEEALDRPASETELVHVVLDWEPSEDGT